MAQLVRRSLRFVCIGIVICCIEGPALHASAQSNDSTATTSTQKTPMLVPGFLLGLSFDFGSVRLEHSGISDFEPAVRAQYFTRETQVGQHMALGTSIELPLCQPLSLLFESRISAYSAGARLSHSVQAWRGNLYDSGLTDAEYTHTTEWMCWSTILGLRTPLHVSNFEAVAGLELGLLTSVSAVDSATVGVAWSWFKPGESPSLPTTNGGRSLRLFNSNIARSHSIVLSALVGIEYRIHLHYLDILPGIRYEHTLNSMYSGQQYYDQFSVVLRGLWRF